VFRLFVEELGFGQGPVFRPDMLSRNPDLVNEAFRQYASCPTITRCCVSHGVSVSPSSRRITDIVEAALDLGASDAKQEGASGPQMTVAAAPLAWKIRAQQSDGQNRSRQRSRISDSESTSVGAPNAPTIAPETAIMKVAPEQRLQ
jgi:hypothetical protein